MIFENFWEYIIGALLILVPVAIIVLEVIERGLFKKEKIKKPTKNSIYLEKLNKIDRKNLDNTIEDIDLIARDFFKEAFGIKKFKGYSELERLFTKNSKNTEALFSRDMIKLLYSKNEKSPQRILRALSLLQKIIENNPIEIEKNSK